LSNVLYGSSFVTKDLFYSGHTATLLLIYFNLKKKSDRYYVLLCTTCVGILVLVQHVHYLIDVVSAPFFTYCCYLLGARITDPILRPVQKKQTVT
jgi:PAP2 superfamily C-terminal